MLVKACSRGLPRIGKQRDNLRPRYLGLNKKKIKRLPEQRSCPFAGSYPEVCLLS
jgi:hypothetical protein